MRLTGLRSIDAAESLKHSPLKGSEHKWVRPHPKQSQTAVVFLRC